MIGGSYNQIDYVYDIAQLLHQKQMSPVTVIGHSLGGSISLLYTALHPERVNKLVAIEGMGPPPAMIKERMGQNMGQRLHNWMDGIREKAEKKGITVDEMLKIDAEYMAEKKKAELGQ